MELLKNILFINLQHRTDRVHHIRNEFKKLGIIRYERFNAIKTSSGSIGCTLSHIKCLEIAKERNYPFVFVCEDDITFTNPSLFLENLDKFQKLNLNWDVLIIGGNTCPPFHNVSNNCVKVFNVQTTTGYIIKSHYYDRLINNFKEGLQMLIREPHNKKMFAIDIYWKSLQQKDNWFMTIPLTVNQYYDYSDIEEKVVDYTNAMLDLEKKELLEYFRKQQQQLEKQQHDATINFCNMKNVL